MHLNTLQECHPIIVSEISRAHSLHVMQANLHHSGVKFIDAIYQKLFAALAVICGLNYGTETVQVTLASYP